MIPLRLLRQSLTTVCRYNTAAQKFHKSSFASPLAKAVIFSKGPLRGFNMSSNKPNSYLASNSAATPHLAPREKHTGLKADYLKQFTVSELISFMFMGLSTINKPVLQLCIKLFPYVPMPVIKALVYKIYCGGETIEEVIKTGERLTERGINNMMISLTIEATNGNKNVDPQFIVSETQRSIKDILIPHTVSVIKNSGKEINLIPAGYVALKPTGLIKNAAAVLKNHDSPEYKEAFEELVTNASDICKTIFVANKELSANYPDRVAPFVVAAIDAEKYDLQPGVYELQRRLYKQFNPLNAPVSVVGTLQMYLTDSADMLTKEEQLAKEQKYRVGLKMVRGAYIHSEPDRAHVIHKTKEDTDKNYNAGITYCIKSIMEDRLNKSAIGHLVVASHNAESLHLATEQMQKLSSENSKTANVCLGQLLGMADSVTYDLIKNYNVDNVIKYVPWGPPLETKEYLLRRLEENGDAVKNYNGLPLVKAAITALVSRIFA